MSLRTKLLAAVMGLNGIILLLALYLLLRSEASGPTPPSEVLVADLVALGSGSSTLQHDPAGRRQLRLTVESLEDSGVVRDLVFVEETAGGGTAPDHGLWSAAAYLREPARGEELPAGDLREEAEKAFVRARRHQRNRWLGPDVVAVVLPPGAEDGVRLGVVARYVVPPSGRSGIRLVYVVMVVGVIVLTGVSFWLLSRLVIRPLARISEAAGRIAAGDYSIQVERHGTNDELDRTTAAFNRMAREIGEYQSHLEDRVLSALNRMRKAEQHLAIAQRLAATGKLASGVAHEINNPLGGMKNAIRALARGDLPPDKTREYLDLITEGLGRVEETVKKFLTFTPRRLEPRPTDLADVASKAVALARHRIERAGVRIEEVLPEPGTAMVFGDPHELQQVALNLLINAGDAAAGAPDGYVRVRVEPRAEDVVVLSVEDNGVGLDAEDQDRCFDMFFTTKDVGEGSGLGLAVAHTIVTNHGGRIELESERGAGAVFRVILPAEVRETEDAAAALDEGLSS